MKRILLAVGCLWVGSLHGAEAVFSSQGSKVYMPPIGDGSFVNELDLKSHEITQRQLGEFMDGKPVRVLSTFSTDQVLLGTAETVWRWNTVKNTITRVVAVPAGETIEDIAFDAKNRWTVIATYRVNEAERIAESKLWMKREDAQGLAAVQVRRVENMQGPVFDLNGNLYFGCRGDLWHGQIQWEADSEPARGVLLGYRFCPVATLETSMSNSTQTGARGMAWAGSRLYVHVKRMGGSGWGDIVSVAVPEAQAGESGELDLVYDLTRRATLYQKSLSSIKRQADGGGWAHLCATSDGKTVHYTTGSAQGRLHWLVHEHGEPAQITDLTGVLK